MASYMSNWWRKHDMDRDGKGCCLIVLAMIAGVFLAGCTIAGLAVWALIK